MPPVIRLIPIAPLVAALAVTGCSRPEALDAPASDAAREAGRQVLAPIADLLAEPQATDPPEAVDLAETENGLRRAAADLRTRGAELSERQSADAETRARIAAGRARLEAARRAPDGAAPE